MGDTVAEAIAELSAGWPIVQICGRSGPVRMTGYGNRTLSPPCWRFYNTPIREAKSGSEENTEIELCRNQKR